MNASQLQKIVPYPLDKFNNQAFVSIVPFKMSNIHLNGLPAITSSFYSLWELNLRTYVNVDGIKGIYFLTLDANSIFGTLIAKNFFSLPYRYAFMRQNLFSFEHQYKSLNSFSVNYEVGEMLNKSQIDLWATERYSLFTHKNNQHFRGIVEHKPWDLYQAKVKHMRDDFSSIIGEKFHKEQIISPSYCPELDVRFQKFRKL